MKNKGYYTCERLDLLSLIPEGTGKVLDVGCGEGLLGKQIKDKLGAEVTGIELDETSSRVASDNLDKVISGNIETLDLPFGKGQFDCIVAADVLEHLTEPWKTLKELRVFLKDNGLIVSSIPNIRYYKAVIRLFKGYWDYVDHGILDRSHLRFFTLINIEEMFTEAGFSIEKIVRNKVSARGFRILNRVLLGSLKDFLTYQYYIVARKDPSLQQEGAKRQAIQF